MSVSDPNKFTVPVESKVFTHRDLEIVKYKCLSCGGWRNIEGIKANGICKTCEKEPYDPITKKRG